MINFCLMTGINYLAKSLALYESLRKHCKDDFRLFYFAFDNKTYEIVKKLKLKNIELISMQEFEDEDLLRIKETRTIAEYFFTCTPSIIYYAIKKYNLDHCVYLDADIFFFSSPKILLKEMNEASIMLTEHRYDESRFPQNHESGTYCVQFMPFKNDDYGMRALNWWKESCIEWCYLRAENKKWADQGYLEDWLTRFKGVCVSQNYGAGVAPWNVSKYEFYVKNNKIWGQDKLTKQSFELLFYHFEALRFYKDNRIALHGKKSNSVMKLIYHPYIKLLLEINDRISSIENGVDGLGLLKVSRKKLFKSSIKKILIALDLFNGDYENYIKIKLIK